MTQSAKPTTRKVQPPGKRWGLGVGSLLPFLSHAFKSHPHGPDEESRLGFLETAVEDRVPRRRRPQPVESQQDIG